MNNQTEYEIQYWPIFLLSSETFIGCCGLKPYRLEEKQLELGFHLGKNHWGLGYASEAARAVIRLAFEAKKAAALFAGHHPENQVSRRLLLKLGFRPAGTVYYEPTGLDHPWYELTTQTFQED